MQNLCELLIAQPRVPPLDHSLPFPGLGVIGGWEAVQEATGGSELFLIGSRLVVSNETN